MYIRFLSFCVCVPNQQRWHAKWKLSWNTYALRTHFLQAWRRLACSVGDYQQKLLHRSLGGKFIKSALLVGCVCVPS